MSSSGQCRKRDASGELSLDKERDRLLHSIEEAPRARHQNAELPHTPGIYLVWPVDERAARELGLRDVPGEPSLDSRPLYLGKATDSIAKRLAKHFTPGDTGHSTLRRTLASLLNLESRPRLTRIRNPTPAQLRTLVANFDLTGADEERLSRWMEPRLEVCGAACAYTPVGDLERAVGAVLRPPLDQERPPMWEPNPWRGYVADCRRRLREHARSYL